MRYPRLSRVGLSGLAVTFAPEMTDAANRAAIAFRAVVDAQGWPEVIETASTLVSCYVAVDLTQNDPDTLRDKLGALLDTRDWLQADLPTGRKLWTLPCCFEGDAAPQMGDAAHQANMSEPEARRDLMQARVRVITLGYAPGQPYLGPLAPHWDIPRQSDLTPKVPAGALVVAIRQLVLFSAAMPTGWRHIGTTPFRTFDPDRASPVALTPGDEMRFAAITKAELRGLQDGDSLGGATWEPLP